MSERKPAEVFHLSEFINEELTERGWTLRDLVFRMRIYENEEHWAIDMLAWELFMAVPEKGLLFTRPMAEDLAFAFGDGITPEFFINLDAAWRNSTS